MFIFTCICVSAHIAKLSSCIKLSMHHLMSDHLYLIHCHHKLNKDFSILSIFISREKNIKKIERTKEKMEGKIDELFIKIERNFIVSQFNAIQNLNNITYLGILLVVFPHKKENPFIHYVSCRRYFLDIINTPNFLFFVL